jgi:hypothetical protein
LPADFEGNGYVTVQFVRDAASDELFMSPLSFGVAAFGADQKLRTPISLSAGRHIMITAPSNSASGGTGPYTWTADGLPNGFALHPPHDTTQAAPEHRDIDARRSAMPRQPWMASLFLLTGQQKPGT